MNALHDDVADVRAAAVWVMSTFLATGLDGEAEMWPIQMTWNVTAEINSTVRKVYLVAFQHVVVHRLAEIRMLLENKALQGTSPIMKFLSVSRKDPNPFVAKMAESIVDFVKSKPLTGQLPLPDYSSYFLEQSATKFNDRTKPVAKKPIVDGDKRGNTWNGRSKGKQFYLQKDSSMRVNLLPQHLALNPGEDSLVLSNGSLLLWKSLISDSEIAWNAGNTPKDTAVTSLQFITTNQDTPVVTGYSDGTVRLWTTSRQTWPLASFRAFNEPSPSDLHLGWQRQAERIVAAGASVQVWDVRAERKIADLSFGSPVTSVTCSTTDSTFALGYRDGHSRVFDVRLASGEGCCINIIPPQRPGQAVVASSIRNEDTSLAVCLEGGAFFRTDQRYPERELTSWQADRECTLVDIHPTVPLVAFGGARGVCVYNLDGELQSKIKTRHAPTAMAFHPDQIRLVVGRSDGKVSVYSSNRKNTL